MRVAVIGKGGAGKSFVTGTIGRVLARRGDRVVVFDSDPMPGVSISLGLGPIADDMLSGAVEKGPDDRWRLKKGIGPARAVTRYSKVGPDGVRLLQFGKPISDGMAPIMGSLNGFTLVVRRLANEPVLAGWSFIGDLPAGPRQMAYDWAPYATQAIVVVEPTSQSVLTARRVARLVRERGRATPRFVANKVRSSSDVALVAEGVGEQPIIGIPHDPSIRAADVAGVAAIDHTPTSEAVSAIHELVVLLDREWSDLAPRSGRDTLRARTSSGGRP